MLTRMTTLMLSAMLLVSAPLAAHHSTAMFDDQKQVTMTGIVKEFQFTNPHSWLILDITGEDGTVSTWGFEAEGPTTLMRSGIRKSTFEVGAEVTITGNPMKDGRPAAAWTSATLEDGTVLDPRAGFVPR